MNRLKTLFALLFVITDIFCSLFDPETHHFKIHRLEKCDEADHTYSIFVNVNNLNITNQDGITAHLQGFLEIKRPIQTIFRLAIHGLLCKDSNDRICKHTFIRKFGYVCKKLHEVDRPWYEFLKEKFKCPIPIGYYNLGNVSIDINSLSYLPLEEGYWIIKTFGFQGSDVVLCVYSEMEIYYREP